MTIKEFKNLRIGDKVYVKPQYNRKGTPATQEVIKTDNNGVITMLYAGDLACLVGITMEESYKRVELVK
jgi:hypothetical protein